VLKLIVILILAALGGYALLQARRLGRRRDHVDLLSEVATIFGGEVLPARRREAWGSVRFEHAGHGFTLRREERARAGAVEACCVVETSPSDYAGPAFELVGRGEQPSHLLPAGADKLELAIEEWGDKISIVAAAESEAQVTRALDDAETRRVVGYALDKRSARLHLSPKGIWFECSGFPENRELIAAIARTAAIAIAQLLDRTRP